MTWFNYDPSDDKDLPTAADISAPPEPTTGFAANFSAAMSSAYQNHSMMGAVDAMADIEQTQLDKLYQVTGERMSPVFPGPIGGLQSGYLHVLDGDASDVQRQEYADNVQQQISKYDTLAQQHGLLTYEQMFKQVQAQAQLTEGLANDVASNQTFAGWLGSLAGGVVGSMSLRDPINLATLAIGAPGKTILMRTAGQIGLNGIAQAGELLAGGADTQKLLLGQGPTTKEEIEQIALAGLGAGALHLGGEGLAAGVRGVIQHFGGAAAPDVIAAAVAHDASEAIGPSPFGDSRVAEAARDDLVRGVLNRDTPLNMQPLPPLALSPAALADRAHDDLFTGTSAPLANLFDRLPDGFDTAKATDANRQIVDLTARIDGHTQAATELDNQIAARTSDEAYDPGAVKRTQAQIDTLNAQIADTTDKRELGQLTRDKAQLEITLTQAENSASDLKAMSAQRDDIGSAADTLRLQRSRIVADLANGSGAKKSAALATVDSGLGPIGQARPPSTAEAIERELAKPAPEPTGQFRILPPPEPVEGAPARPPAGERGSGETVELGQHSGAIDMDTVIPWGTEDGPDGLGRPAYASIRDILKDIQDGNDLVKAMQECVL